MLNRTKYNGFVAAAVLSLALVGPASAATISWSDGSSPAGNVAPTSTTPGVDNPGVLVDLLKNVPDVARSPFQGTALYNVAKFNSVGADATATYAFDSMRAVLSLIWGSVDTYNFIDFYKGNALVDTFSGANPAAEAKTPGANRPLNQILATLRVDGGFNKIVLRSEGKDAFEHASVVAAVPVPAAGFLLVGALGGLVALRRRKAAV